MRCARRAGASSAGGRTGSRTRRRSARAVRAGRGRGGRARSRRTCRRRPRAVRRSSRAIAARSTIPACAMISAGGQCRSSRRASESAIGGSPRPPWMRMGTRRSAASAKTGSSRGSSGKEALRPRVELDAPRAEIEASGRLLDRRLVEVEPHEREELAGRCGGVRERPVVRRREGRVVVGLVEAEHERPRDPVRTLDRQELLAVSGHAVDVFSEVRVRVDDAPQPARAARVARELVAVMACSHEQASFAEAIEVSSWPGPRRLTERV